MMKSVAGTMKSDMMPSCGMMEVWHDEGVVACTWYMAVGATFMCRLLLRRAGGSFLDQQCSVVKPCCYCCAGIMLILIVPCWYSVDTALILY